MSIDWGATIQNEAKWFTCSNPHEMLKFQGDRISDRKLRLFTCACCRSFWTLLDDKRSRWAVEVAEKLADGNATLKEVSQARVEAEAAAREAIGESWMRAAWNAGWVLARNIRGVTHLLEWPFDPTHADLFRHIAGNPWRPLHIDDGHPDNWHVYPDDIHAVFLNGPLPATVTRLAEALYRGEDCAFALHDVLVECGQDELAQHFREPGGHPKGCAWLDAILGKE